MTFQDENVVAATVRLRTPGERSGADLLFKKASQLGRSASNAASSDRKQGGVGFVRRPRFRIALGRKNVNLISPGGVRAVTGAI